MSINH